MDKEKESEKPFRSIEAVDAKTRQLCKIACMSCIRGHRTTSCGLPICRSKIFWTVKRPGRPSNSCTCRYGAIGGCKCVVARTACPHKSKKGEKRPGDCRCDEFGRYCCLLEPDDWNALLSLRKPTVDFFPTREALEAKQAAANKLALPPAPARSTVTSPPSIYSVLATPVPQVGMHDLPSIPHIYTGYQSLSPALTPAFCMMEIGTPMSTQGSMGPDALIWQGQARPASREFSPIYNASPSAQGPCYQASKPIGQGVQLPDSAFHQLQEVNAPLSHPFTDVPDTVNLSHLSPAPFDLDKLRIDYFQHQLPNSICQNCGLSGCTCRNCPPVFQNFGTTSWAQCCGRKHARDQTTPEPQKVPRTEQYEPAPNLHHEPSPGEALFMDHDLLNGGDTGFGDSFQNIALPPDYATYPLDCDFGHGLSAPGSTDGVDLSEFLVSDLDSSHPMLLGSNSPMPKTDDGKAEREVGEGSGDGCCCSGGTNR